MFRVDSGWLVAKEWASIASFARLHVISSKRASPRIWWLDWIFAVVPSHCVYLMATKQLDWCHCAFCHEIYAPSRRPTTLICGHSVCIDHMQGAAERLSECGVNWSLVTSAIDEFLFLQVLFVVMRWYLPRSITYPMDWKKPFICFICWAIRSTKTYGQRSSNGRSPATNLLVSWSLLRRHYSLMSVFWTKCIHNPASTASVELDARKACLSSLTINVLHCNLNLFLSFNSSWRPFFWFLGFISNQLRFWAFWWMIVSVKRKEISTRDGSDRQADSLKVKSWLNKRNSGGSVIYIGFVLQERRSVNMLLSSISPLLLDDHGRNELFIFLSALASSH